MFSVQGLTESLAKPALGLLTRLSIFDAQGADLISGELDAAAGEPNLSD